MYHHVKHSFPHNGKGLDTWTASLCIQPKDDPGIGLELWQSCYFLFGRVALQSFWREGEGEVYVTMHTAVRLAYILQLYTLNGRLHLGTGRSHLRLFLPFIAMQLERVRVVMLSLSV